MAKILVVECDPMVATFISRALRSRGFLVDVADNGPSAIELSATGRYRIVVLDLTYPRLDGIAVLRKMLAVRPEQKVIALSGAKGSDAGLRALEAGAADYLNKPFSVDELLARVAARLQDVPYTQSALFLSYGGVTLDLARRKVDTGRGAVSLTEREFVLLAYLMSQQGRVFSRQELLSEVWGFSFDPGSNVVDVYIKRLRAKLGCDVIETVRNVGYSLRVA